MDLNYYPFNEPTYKGKIVFPKDDKIYVKEYYNKKYYVESLAPPDIDIDISRLREGRVKEDTGYNITELKKYAKMLDIQNFSKLNKKELVALIKAKLKI